MTKFAIYFDRSGFPMAIYEGTLKGCRKFIADTMTVPQTIKGKKVLVSHAAVWNAGNGSIHGDTWYGEFQMGSDGKIRIGMWLTPDGKCYLLHRDGSLAKSIDRYDYGRYQRKEYNSRAKMVKGM